MVSTLTDSPTGQSEIPSDKDFIFYLFDERNGLKVLTTLERPLTPEEFEVVEHNLMAYRYIMGDRYIMGGEE